MAEFHNMLSPFPIENQSTTARASKLNITIQVYAFMILSKNASVRIDNFKRITYTTKKSYYNISRKSTFFILYVHYGSGKHNFYTVATDLENYGYR